MIKKIASFFLSTKLMAALFLVFAVAMALATFIEEIYSTEAAKSLIYEAKWFEIIMLLLIICFVGNIKRYRLLQKKKWTLLTFHLAFIIIFIGGFFSRYIGFEGMMAIREGQSSNEIISEKPYIKLQIRQNEEMLFYKDFVRLNPIYKNYEKKFDFQGQLIKLKLINYIPNAKEKFMVSENGKNFIKVVSTNRQGRSENFIQKGEVKLINGLSFSFGTGQNEAINLIEKQGKLHIYSPFEGRYTIMATQQRGFLAKKTLSELKLRSLYEIAGLQIVIPEFPQKGLLIYQSEPKDENLLDFILMEVSSKREKKIVSFFGKKNSLDLGGKFYLENKEIHIGYGSVVLKTPFYLKLDKFELEKYPGSKSPSSFASEVSLIDENQMKNHRIFMNNTLDYKGYRFFQSGYDKDEKGTQLSVNFDKTGTRITYLGYILLGIGMFFTLFWKGTRFTKLKGLLKNSPKTFLFFLLLNFNFLHAQHKESIKKISIEEFTKKTKIPKNHAAKFGRLAIQDTKGRMKPLNTMALELLRKIYHKSSIGDFEANSWMISIHQDPISWSQIDFIKVDKKAGDEFLSKVKANSKGYTSLINLYKMDPKSGEIKFILQEDYKNAFAKNPSLRTHYDKALIDLNEKVGIIAGIFQGNYLKILPLQNDPKNSWISWNLNEIKPENQISINLIKDYFKNLHLSLKNGSWDLSNKALDKIAAYQKKIGHQVIPSPSKLHVEILYNKLTIFYFVMLFYLFVGLSFFILAFVKLFFNFKFLKFIAKALHFGFFGIFLYHVFGLILRWYISGHAPWSNGYESAVFISWVIILAGLLFSKRGNLFPQAIAALSATALLGVAHGNLMNPEITDLVPVLKSYWLMIHVAVITSSYGFFSIGAFLGLSVLMLLIARGFVKNEKIEFQIARLSIINEMTLTIGLFLLTIGTFLGGVWANESWGRYWSWDPKETWAFISVMVYAFVLHMRLVPALRGSFAFNLASLLALSSIIMTYFGVNYYLSGLHSYAKGEPVPIPYWIYYAFISIGLLAIWAYYSNKKTNSTI